MLGKVGRHRGKVTRGVHHFTSWVVGSRERFPLHPVESYNSFMDLAFFLAHRLVSSFDTACNGLSPPLVDIIRFNLLHIIVNFLDFKTCLLGRSFLSIASNFSIHWISPIK